MRLLLLVRDGSVMGFMSGGMVADSVSEGFCNYLHYTKRYCVDRLAEAAKPEELTEAVLRSIEGFGEARMKKYAEGFLKG